MAERVESVKLASEGSSVEGLTGSGRGLEIEFTETDGVIDGYTIINGGVDYTATTPLTVYHQTGSGADIEIASVDGSGVVLTITINDGGTGYYSVGKLYAPNMIMANLVELEWYDPVNQVDDPLYLTNAFNNIKWYDDGTFTTNKEFQALGALGSIDAIQEGFELQTYGVSLTLSGIPIEFRQEVFQALNFQTAFQNRKCRIYAAFLDNNYNIIGDPILMFAGQMDDCVIEIGSSVDIKIGVQSRLINWEIPRGGRYNSEDQKVWYPNDTGFDLIPGLIDKEVDWGGKGTGVLGTGGGGGGPSEFGTNTIYTAQTPWNAK